MLSLDLALRYILLKNVAEDDSRRRP